ncbi:e3 ubiquitin-protein ligase [Gigaspora margarita]|uniref:E3 ubiquitin-protein ligase n=1 Tax=Gigaspora margarita TaxID=4874 RepID=A0A8H4AW45_GIGMA|nr:e3 ubiquitin-protein ligase [Gigaspora margarita]
MSIIEDTEIITVFHVHLPFNTDSYKPAVLGSCEALGYWRTPKVWLHQIPNSTLWVSDRVLIPANLDVQYKYCLVSSEQVLNFEGFEFATCRRMEPRGNLYDIWRDSINFRKDQFSNREEYVFTDYIYKNIKSPYNLKIGIMDYQYVLNKYWKELTEFKKIVSFISQHLKSNKTKEQILFLYVLLGYHIEQNGWMCRSYLSDGFQSAIMLKEFKNIDDDFSLPSNTKFLVVNAISALVQHNSKHGSIDWISIFALMPKFDASYSFIDSIEIINDKKQPDDFIKILDVLRPSINDLDNAGALSKMIDKLVRMSYDVECLAYMLEYFKELKNCDSFLCAIRRKLLELLKKKKLHWNDKNITSLHKLLHDPNLKWLHREYAIMLEAIADSDQIIVLEFFPEAFKYIMGLNSNMIKKELEQESIKWLINICKQKGCSAYNIFHYLSTIHSTSTQSRELLNKFMNHNIVMSLSDDSILSITSRININDFHEDIITHFMSLLKLRVGYLVQDPDERLLKIIMQICDSESILNIPNSYCEEIICFILSQLQQDKTVKFSETESFQLSLFQFANFWTAIFKANGDIQKLCSHSYFKETCKTVTLIATDIRNNTITIKLLQKIFIYFRNNEILKDYINSAIENYSEESELITDEIIEKNYNQCKVYNSTLERLQKFYGKFCPSKYVQDVQSYLNDLTKKSTSTTLKESYVESHWSMHSVTIEIIKDYYPFIDSQTFYNVFQIELNEGLTVKEIMNNIFKKIVKSYEIKCREHENKEIKCTDVIEFWTNVNSEYVDKEVKLMTPYFEKLKSSSNSGHNASGTRTHNIQGLISSVKLLVNITPTLERLRQLMIVVKDLDIILCDQDFWVEELINNLDDKELLLYQLCETFDKLNKIEMTLLLTDDIWLAIKEICDSKDFVIFLKSLVGNNLQNLINGVDEHSDERLIQENIVQTFIQVKQILEPLLEEKVDNDGHSAVQEFFQILYNIVNRNPSLISKLRLCNANAQALKNLCKNISNRGEVTKEKIIYSVTKGEYLFSRMKDDENKYTATLSYFSDISQESVVIYTFTDLQDLRGRALLIARAPSNTKAFSKNEIDKIRETQYYMNEFIVRVDLAQEIIDTASSLKELGHFNYLNFEESTRTTLDMKNLLNTLLDDLREWKKIVNEAQQNHYYLTFFLAQHILNFYDYFSYNEKVVTTQSRIKRRSSIFSKIVKNFSNSEKNLARLIIKEECAVLLKSVNNKAELPNVSSDILKIPLEPKDYNNYYNILCKIGTILHDIFNRSPSTQRQMIANVKHETADVICQGRPFIATCNNKFQVPNIIMSLYNLHNKCYPEAWQVLICKSSTTIEELLTFTKRCFYAAKNGYGEHLFCIANVELLDFELQYQLVSNIRSLCQQEKKFYLALICCIENNMHHHILDQFSENVHVVQGFDAVSMRNIYEELCPYVWVVSSDLSGQGKSKWIEEQSSNYGSIPRKFLISDEMTFGTLVHQLSEIRLKNTESLHLNMMLIENNYDVNMFLFELLSFKIVRDRANFLRIPSTLIYIEVESTMNQGLLNSIPIIGNLKRKHLTWNVDNTIIPQDADNPIQIVSRYLDAHDRDTINLADIDLNNREQTIPEARCRQLLKRYFFDRITEDIKTYRFLEIFANVLSDQLMRMSSSEFFRIGTLKLMEADGNIRKTLLETLIKVSMDFATRSVNSKNDQLNNLSNNLINTTIKHWEDLDHLLVFFLSQSPGSICALYRYTYRVPKNVEDLLRSQHLPKDSDFKLDDYNKMSSDEILKKLESLARTTFDEREYVPYALSTDNLLKMALILLRSRANIPVVICGEAGCGKTSLIQFLSIVVDVELRILNLHAGVTKQQILEFLSDAEKIAEKNEIWLFFDEINTCNHIGILADLIAHRLLLGKEIHKNIRLFAACNPYRLRQKADTQAGLLVDRYEERNCLVYQVRPLPDQILDFVWDYGVLKPSDEKIHINMMIKRSQENAENTNLFTELLFESQEFLRTHEGVHSVSLRDVKRAIIIFEFFHKSLVDRQNISERISKEQDNIGTKILRAANNIKSRFEKPNNIIKSYILALSLCYQVRFFDQELRNQYQDKMCEIFEKFKVKVNSKTFMEVIRDEQKDFMKRMTKPNMVAENFALLENVLVITVCILTRIPLFIVGAPGASKSLAIRIVSQSLRGNDSDDPYFRTLPQVYLVHYQGSTSSTSEGIITVFNKATKYQEGNSEEFPLITVVLLDEIGLAEKSPHNPLKVLHSLLEPNYPAELPEVAVIGISNWRLDNSKSSRALLVQRPNLESKDLIYTTKLLLGEGTESQFRALVDSYLEYRRIQPINNFHGLRDYYSLVKSLGGGEIAQMALARNFGGTSKIDELYKIHFNEVIKEFQGSIDNFKNYSIDDLIKANLMDKNSRHLMVIGKSDSIVNILTYKLKQWNKMLGLSDSKFNDDAKMDLEPVVIYGSQFPNDFDGDYQYSVLSRIMMCVEAGRPLILTDLDTIYGSLYDLWNQNYITVGKEGSQIFYTRVALGAYSNPMVCVHENFRCILVLDEKKVDYSDPPLLNRFEKHKLTINDTIDDSMKGLLNKLVEWSNQISNIEVETAKFNENDIFIGFDKEETLQSLVIYNGNDPELNDEQKILHKCKELLIGMAMPDGIVRSKKSMLSNDEVDYWYKFYFEQQYHEDFPGYIRSLLNDYKKAQGFNSIVYTFSNINTDIESCLNNILKCQVDKLSTFKSEAQFQSRIKHFWLESEDEILVLQCDLNSSNSECIKLAKFIIEQYKNEFMASKNFFKQVKHVCMILHLKKENATSTISSFNFMCGWDLFAIETLIPQDSTLQDYLDKDLINVLETTYTFEKILDRELLWCLLCIEFPPSCESADYIRSLVQKIPRHKELMNWIKERTFEWLHDKQFKDWQLNIAINRKDLYLYSSFLTALQMYICNQVRKPVAQFLFALEKVSGLLITDSDNLLLNEENINDTIWEPIIMNTKIVNTENIKMPYIIKNHYNGLKLPFSTYFMDQINKFKSIYQDDLMTLERVPENLDKKTGKLKSQIIDDCIERFSEHLISIVPVLKIPQFKLPNAYFNDFTTIMLHGKTDNNQVLRRIISYHMKQEVPDPIRLHIFWWSNEDLVLTELQLALLLQSIAKEEIINIKFDEIGGFNIDDYLLNRVIITMINELFKIIEDNNNNNNEDLDERRDTLSLFAGIRSRKSHRYKKNNLHNMQMKLQVWQCDVEKILSISFKLPNSSDNKLLNMLRIYNDLSKSISSSQLLQIKQCEIYPFSKQSVDIVFTKLDEIEKTEINLSSRQSFIHRCLSIIPLKSSIRSYLYEKIFSQETLKFAFPNIYLIFKSENMVREGLLFFSIIDDPKVIESTKRLQVIENILSNRKNSEMSALCCDAIQTQLSAGYQFNELSNYFLKAINVLISNDSKELQKITAIALLKEFANEFWSHKESINLDNLNNHLEVAHPFIHSFKIYLLKSLYLKGLGTSEIELYCDALQEILPWVRVLKTDPDSRLGFNPYWYFNQFKQMDHSFKVMFYNDELTVNNLLNTITENGDVTQKCLLAGMIISKFYLVRASRELSQNENILMQRISKYLQLSQLPQNYKMYLLNFMTNSYQLYELSPKVESTDVFISSVAAHVVALHISNPINASPLTRYMHALYDHKDTYIVTCPSDELSLLTNVIIANDFGTRRYKCKCGNIYFIGECGRPYQISRCNQCNNEIGGLDHVLKAGSSDIDRSRLEGYISVNDKIGYIIEDTFDDYHSVRNLDPAAYRILHLFLHIIIGSQAHMTNTADFINDQHINVVQYCKKHIENDWKALKSIFNCKDETLALVIHSILSEMSQGPLQNVGIFTSPTQREAWEKSFSQKYILPRIKNFIGTANDFRIVLDKNAENSVEINETMEVTDHYNENYLPILWRLIEKPDLDSLRSYCMSNTENTESFPLLYVFLKHEKYLNLIQLLLPIVNFTQILSSRLSNAIERQKARHLTFHQFIINESEDDETGATEEFLNAAFNSFANSWNRLIPHIKRYQCKELPQEMPIIDNKAPIIYGLYEPNDESLYLCAAIEFLVQLQNNFLNDIMETSGDAYQSSNFIEESGTQTSIQESSYFIQSISLENAKPEQIIEYDDISEVFIYCQYDLRLGHGREIYYDLYKIETELAQKLVYGKKLIKTNKDQMYLNTFIYHKELFSRSMTILEEIKNLIRQEPIPADNNPEISENQMELLSALEIIICFLKQTSGGDCDTLISDYIENWMKLNIKKEKCYKLLMRTRLQLKHIVALYELVEEHVADTFIAANCLSLKYKAELNESIKQAILEAVDFKQANFGKSIKIPADAFLIALKRLIVRYLSTNSETIKENVPLYDYIGDDDNSLGCWPDDVSMSVIEDKFPTALLTSHIYYVYQFAKERRSANIQAS